MTSAFRPPGNIRERILAFGGESSGKTTAALNIARKCLGPTDTMYVIDCDWTWDKYTDGSYADLGVREHYYNGQFSADGCNPDGRLVIWHTSGWEEHQQALRDIWKNIKPDDWFVVDSMTHLWADIQDWYIQTVHGSDMPTFLIEARIDALRANKGVNEQSTMLVEYKYVNKVWRKEFAQDFVAKRCHKYVIAEAKDLRTDSQGHDKETKSIYHKLGKVPDTQKRVGYNANTIWYMVHEQTGKFLFDTTAKDNDREKVTRVEQGDMAMTYLFKIAGWRPRKIEG